MYKNNENKCFISLDNWCIEKLPLCCEIKNVEIIERNDCDNCMRCESCEECYERNCECKDYNYE